MRSVGHNRHAPQPAPRLDIRGPLAIAAVMVVVTLASALGSAAFMSVDTGAGFAGAVIAEPEVVAVRHAGGGTVRRVHVTQGMRVQGGDLLVSLDTAVLDAEIGRLRRQAEAATAQLTALRTEATALADTIAQAPAGRSRLAALEQHVAALDKATADLLARIALVEKELASCEIRAPVAGRVRSLAVRGAGAEIAAAATVLEIGPVADRVLLEGRLPARYAATATPGMRVKVWPAGTAWRSPLAARIDAVARDAGQQERAATYRVRVALDAARDPFAADAGLQPGAPVDIFLVTGEVALLDRLLEPVARNIHRLWRP
jgi:multidrug efflux pump subunit AcrA (membrane-fusion protein)